MPLPFLKFQPDRWNNLNTTTSLFLMNAVLTCATGGVVLGVVLLCGFAEGREIAPRAESILNAWLLFLTSMWGAGVGQFWVKRRTHVPGGTADQPGPGGRTSTPSPVQEGA